MILLMVSSLSQTLLVIRVVWGAAAISPGKTLKEQDEDDPDEADIRTLKVTSTKKTFVFLMVVLVNLFLFDYLGHGIIATDTRAPRVLTMLRSPKEQDRIDAVGDSILLTGDKRVAKALIRVIETPGEAREWAAHATGVRHDVIADDSLLKLLKTGSPRERAGAALALARIRDYRLLRVIDEVFPELGDLKGDFFKAIGMLGKTRDTSENDLKTTGTFLREQLINGKHDKKTLRVIIWAIGRFEAPEGLVPLEELLSKPGDNATLCVGLEALGRIGSASTSPILIETIYTIDRKARCPEIVYADFSGLEEHICVGVNVVERLLHEIGRIGDRRAMPAMEKLSKDKTFNKTVRNLAAEIAFRMNYQQVR
jgi:HEAT repeat protein